MPFQSSKVSKLRDDSSSISHLKKKTPEEEEDERYAYSFRSHHLLLFLLESRTNAENDALLHKLVHTQLLSGPAGPNLDITPGHRRKALAGRVRELAGEARLGKGEKIGRHAERNKAGKRVREGLSLKQKEKEKQELEGVCRFRTYYNCTLQNLAPKGEEFGKLPSSSEETLWGLRSS